MKRKKTDVFKIIRYILAAIQGGVSLLFMYFLTKLDMLPTKYFIIIAAALIVLCLLNIVLQMKKVPGIVMMVVGLIVTGVLSMGSVYLSKTVSMRDKITGASAKIDEVAVYVLSEDNARVINDIAEYKFGILKDQDREITDKALEEISGIVGREPDTSEEEDFFTLVDKLYTGEYGAVVMNTAYADVISETEGYEDFLEKVRAIHLTEVKTEIKWYEEETDMSQYFTLNDDVFTLYISGIDTYGSVAKTSRSDVNIILVANTKTRQMLLLSTPRDYYVPLSISNGVKDKLTHAGIYGINCSKDTLAELYNVPIQYYFRLNFNGFIEIIDALGGITVNSNESFVTRHGKYTINQGINNLDGRQALSFARERYALKDGDRQRAKNQMEVIKQVINKMSSSSMLYNYMDIMDAVSGCIQTSMPRDMINGLVKMQINDMTKWNIVSYSADGKGTRATTYSVPRSSLYVMEPDQATIDHAKELIQKVIDGEIIN